jgi:Tol biopolymer transport system component
MITTRRTLRAGLGLALLSLGGLCGVDKVSAGKPPAAPRVISYLHHKHGSEVNSIRVMDASGGNTATLTANTASDPPRWSPNGQRLLFHKYISGGMDTLVSIAADGSGEQTIVTAAQVRALILSNNSEHTGAGNNIYYYDWSPDGQWAVFTFAVFYLDGSGGERLFAVRIADGALLQLTDNNDAEYHYGPRWSGSLNLISYVNVLDFGPDSELTHSLWVVDPVTLERRQLIGPWSNTPVTGLTASWSNGGNPATGESSLLFQSRPDALIVDVDVDAVDPIVGVERVSIPGYELTYPEWSPDDTQLVMIWGPSGTQQIGTYNLLTGASKVLLKVNLSREWVAGPDWRIAP